MERNWHEIYLSIIVFASNGNLMGSIDKRRTPNASELD